ncbi:unnamed protein product [Mucor hiemalis]
MSESIWKDLLAWQKDINTKDEALSRRKPVHEKTLPQIRSSTEIVLDNLKPVGLETFSSNKKTPQAAPTAQAKKTPQTRAEKAEAEKAKGNEYFVKKDYKNAILHYGKAIDLDPTVPVYFVNCAMAFLKTNSFLEAEKDCTRGIQLQPKNVKALWRRGIALRELGRINEARKDFEAGLAIEPNNKSILDELKKLPVQPKMKEKPKPEPVVVEKRRLPINVIEEAYTETKRTPITKTVKVEEKDPKITPVPITQKERIVATEKTKIPPPSSQNKVDTPTVAKPVEVSTPKVQPVKFTCPRTNFEFERDWKTYKGRGDDILYQYFQCIPPTSFSSLFKSSLESDQFEKMVDLIESRYTKEKTVEDIFKVLEGLSSVKRIDMLIMFLSKKHQQAIQGLFNLVNSSSDIPKDTLAKVAKVYGVRI